MRIWQLKNTAQQTGGRGKFKRSDDAFKTMAMPSHF
jgi:hypothetical protein